MKRMITGIVIGMTFMLGNAAAGTYADAAKVHAVCSHLRDSELGALTLRAKKEGYSFGKLMAGLNVSEGDSVYRMFVHVWNDKTIRTASDADLSMWAACMDEHS